MLAEHLKRRLDRAVERQAIVVAPELVAHLSGFQIPVEDWPVANPLAPCAAVLVVGSREPVLVVASMYAALCDPAGPAVIAYRSYDARLPPAPVQELVAAVAQAIERAGLRPGTVAVDASFPDALRGLCAIAQLEPVTAEERLFAAAVPADEPHLAAIRRSCTLADAAQQSVLTHAQPGRTEIEIAGLAHAAIGAAAGRRVPAILTVTTGPASGGRAGAATARSVDPGDLILVDVAPWIDGAWADAATTVCAGRPTSAQQRAFDAVRGALELAIDRCRPGAIGREVDAAVRERLAGVGPTYPHHTGHGVGVRWWQEPYLTPYGETPIDEGMVIAVEPALYDPVIGGVRLEHTFLVAAGGNELLTRHEHRLTP